MQIYYCIIIIILYDEGVKVSVVTKLLHLNNKQLFKSRKVIKLKIVIKKQYNRQTDIILFLVKYDFLF